jgi:hypothetical protein
MKIVTAAVARMRLLDWVFLIACLAVLAFYLLLTISANSDLAAGRFALFMDERITFDGVKKILHPNGLVQFFDSILNGGDHRYGRSLWNSIAIFSAIPERLFGDSGQIIAARMLQVILIVASYCVFAFGILRSWFLRLVLLVAMLTTPFSDYFMTMPKPEPLQLLFLAIFSYFFVKKNAAFSWYWIFIGLAFGTKISTLPALLVFISIALAARRKGDSFWSGKKPIINAAIAFVVGLAIAVPILFIPLSLSVGGYFAFGWAIRKFDLGSVSRLFIATAEIIVVFLLSRKVLKTWISNTFLNTTHGADQVNINALSWLDYFLDKWLVAPYPIGLMFCAVVLTYLIIHGVQILKSGGVSIDQKTTAFAIAMAGLALNIAIFIGSKRLWGFYLYPGMVLTVAGIIMLSDLSNSKALSTDQRPLASLNTWLGYLISIFLLVISLLYWLPQSMDGLEKRSLRTGTSEYTLQYSSYKKFTDFLDHYKTAENRRLRVMFTPSLFPPESNEKFEIVEFWGPYIDWSKEPDVIIFGIENTPRGEPTSKDSANYNNFLIEREGYAAHVTVKGGACKSVPCFVRELELPNGGEVLVLSQSL